MSWQTPFLWSHASAAVVCTPVTPDMYSMRSPISVQIASAASHGVVATRRSTSRAMRDHLGRRTRARRLPELLDVLGRALDLVGERRPSRAGARDARAARTSTRLVAVSDSSLCGVRISNDETRVPQ